MVESPPVVIGPGLRAQARAAQTRAVRRRPDVEGARLAQALAALDAAESRFQWRDLTGAERLAREAVIGLPNEPRAHYFLGLVLLAMDRASDAAARFGTRSTLIPALPMSPPSCRSPKNERRHDADRDRTLSLAP